MSPIALSSLLSIPDPNKYKVHLACWNEQDQPLDVLVRDRDEWDGWNTGRSTKDEFNMTYILSLAHFYLETDVWLFGGIYEVLSRQPVNQSHSYTLGHIPAHQELIGRLKIKLPRPGRARSVMLMGMRRAIARAHSRQYFPFLRWTPIAQTSSEHA